eukprot:7272084-Pyramimonas_sp.AAC.1
MATAGVDMATAGVDMAPTGVDMATAGTYPYCSCHACCDRTLPRVTNSAKAECVAGGAGGTESAVPR